MGSQIDGEIAELRLDTIGSTLANASHTTLTTSAVAIGADMSALFALEFAGDSASEESVLEE